MIMRAHRPHSPPPTACTSASKSSPAARVEAPTSRPATIASNVHSVLSPQSCHSSSLWRVQASRKVAAWKSKGGRPVSGWRWMASSWTKVLFKERTQKKVLSIDRLNHRTGDMRPVVYACPELPDNQGESVVRTAGRHPGRTWIHSHCM